MIPDWFSLIASKASDLQVYADGKMRFTLDVDFFDISVPSSVEAIFIVDPDESKYAIDLWSEELGISLNDDIGREMEFVSFSTCRLFCESLSEVAFLAWKTWHVEDGGDS